MPSITFTRPSWRTPGRRRRFICALRGCVLRGTGHKKNTDPNGFLFCGTCGQSMTNDGEALGYGEPGSWLPVVGETVCDPNYRHQKVNDLVQEDGEWFATLEDGSRWTVAHSLDPADDHGESDHPEFGPYPTGEKEESKA